MKTRYPGTIDPEKSPDRNTIMMLALQGCTIEKVTYYARGVHHDLFGFIDVLAIQPGRSGLLGVQATDLSNVAARVTKIKMLCAADPNSKVFHWLHSGNRLEVWGWGLRGRGARRMYDVRRLRITLRSNRSLALDVEEHGGQR
jgi:hypothetical protein